MGEKLTMTLNLSEREMSAVDALAAHHEMSKTAVIRQALRLYQMIHTRIMAGETMTFSGDRERVALFVGPGWSPEDRPCIENAIQAALHPSETAQRREGNRG